MQVQSGFLFSSSSHIIAFVYRSSHNSVISCRRNKAVKTNNGAYCIIRKPGCVSEVSACWSNPVVLTKISRTKWMIRKTSCDPLWHHDHCSIELTWRFPCCAVLDSLPCVVGSAAGGGGGQEKRLAWCQWTRLFPNFTVFAGAKDFPSIVFLIYIMHGNSHVHWRLRNICPYSWAFCLQQNTKNRVEWSFLAVPLKTHHTPPTTLPCECFLSRV